MSRVPTATPVWVDRESELAELQGLLEAGEPRLALLTGRRRIGKTYLLARAFPEDEAFFFTSARTSPDLNRRQLLIDFARWSGEPIEIEDHPTWRSVFRLLLDHDAPNPLAIVIDEFQYLADDERGLAEVASELNAVWERKRAARPLVLVLAGSAVGTMEALASGGAPLYGRFHWHHRLRPFDYWNAGKLTPFENPRERARAYGIFGGIPRYLAAVDPTASVADNAIRLMLSPRGEVRQLVETSLDQEEGLRDVAKYRGIVRAVAGGKIVRNEIAQRTGLRNDRALRAKIERLVELGYLEERRNVDAKPNEAVRYAVADAAMRFHQRFVEPNLSLLERVDPERVWTELVAPKLSGYMGHVFEAIVRQAYDRLHDRYGLPLVHEIGRWEGADRNARSLELDLVAPIVDGGTLTGSVKWNREPIDVAVHFDHLGMLERAADAGRKWARESLRTDSPLLYVAAGGFVREFGKVVSRSDRRVVCWELQDLYPEAP